MSTENRCFPSNRASLTQNFREKWSHPTNLSSCHKSRINGLSCSIRMWAKFHSFCHKSRVWQTDGRTALSQLQRPAFNAGVMAEALWVNIDWKSALRGLVSFGQIFIWRSNGRLPQTIFARIDRPVNALQPCRWQYSQRNFTGDFLHVQFLKKNDHFAFLSPPLGLRGNVCCSS